MAPTILHQRRLQVEDLVLEFALLLGFDVENTPHLDGVRLQQLVLLEQLRYRILSRAVSLGKGVLIESAHS